MLNQWNLKIDLRNAQEQIEENVKAARRLSRKTALAYLGALGMAYEQGTSAWQEGVAFAAKAEKRGEEMEEELRQQVSQWQEQADAKVQKWRGRLEEQVEGVAAEVQKGGKTVEQEVEHILSRLNFMGRNGKTAEATEIRVEAEAPAEPPFEGYDEMNVDDVIKHLAGMDGDRLVQVRTHEAAHKNRVTVLRVIDERLAQLSTPTTV
jgi:hypothetical protein